MSILKRVRLAAFVSLLCGLMVGFGLTAAVSGQIKVEVRKSPEGFELLRGGKPYSIRGVGGKANLKLLSQLGGNSIRTWSTDGLERLLDEAQAQGLTVSVGLWLGHERHGFDYQDESAVVGQLEQLLRDVRKFKEHPAVLLWGVGNEMEGDGTNPAVWYAVDHIAREIKRIDPNHPTMTVIAELGEHKLQSIERFCPHIDIIGVNSYGGIATLPERYRKARGSKPYIVTEHGPLGPWEAAKTQWGSPLERSSTEKAERYASGYRHAVLEQAGLSFGSYAFLWGQKQETTATWFGMLLPDGTRLGPADSMSAAWTGRPPRNRCPRIDSLTAELKGKPKPGTKFAVQLSASDPEKDELDVQWILRRDSGTIGVGGDAQGEEAVFSGAVQSQGAAATVTAPQGGGGYRLFAYVRDGQGGAAVANYPFYVDAPVMAVASPRASLPFVLYGDELRNSPYQPSGYMGNAAAIQMDLDCRESPKMGETCLKAQYQADDEWGGVLWQSPPNDWEGAKPGGLNLTGATAVEFWARGAMGGETVNFVLGVVDGEQPYRDTAKAELKEVRLTKEWRKLRIPLNNRDLSRIKTGFGWSLSGQGKPVTFYLDEVRYVDR